MKRARTPLIHLSQIPVETDVPGRPGVTRQLLSQEPKSGAKTRILTFPAGYRSELSKENDGLMESHRSSEEIVVLDGVMSFGRWYDIPALGYTFHPPGWIHPADQHSKFGHRMLIKSGAGEVDFTFTPPPTRWNGQEFSLTDSSDAAPQGVTRADVRSVTHEPILDRLGEASGLTRQPLRDGGEKGWSTWVLTVPRGWTGGVRSNPWEGASGLEFFVLSGDLTCHVDDVLVELTGGSYYSNPRAAGIRFDGAFSRQGAYVMCWTRG